MSSSTDDIPSSALAALQPAIFSILRSSDLTQVSAKRVRVKLGESGELQRHSIDVGVPAHKSAVDEEIKRAFAQVSAESNAAAASAQPAPAASSSSASNGAPRVGIALPGAGIRGDTSASDAAYAVALQKQLNAQDGPSTRGSASAPRKSAGGAAGKKRKLKGNDEISSDEEDGTVVSSANGTPRKKTKTTRKKKSSTTENGEPKPKNPNNPFNKPVVLSAAMAELCGASEMPRYEVTKQLWVYIKANDLQNPANKREILCDDKLKALFGKSAVDSFQMAKLVSAHVKKKEDVVAPKPEE